MNRVEIFVSKSREIDLEVSGTKELEVELAVSETVPESYTGAVTVTPKAYEDQVLATSGKLMTSNVTVLKVPFFQTSAAQGGGMTCYIAQEV